MARLDSTIRMAVEGYDAVLGRRMGLAQEAMIGLGKIGANRQPRHNGVGKDGIKLNESLDPQRGKRARRPWRQSRSGRRNGRVRTRHIASVWAWTYLHAARDARIQAERMVFHGNPPSANPLIPHREGPQRIRLCTERMR